MPTKSTDDFYTHGTVPVEVTFTGCGGEFCPGPKPAGWTDAQWGDGSEPFLCAACRAGTRNTAIQLRPYGMEG